jgi:putative tricarboxylic transport membrane protein
MSIEGQHDAAPPPWWYIFFRKNVLAGLMFVAVAAFGLWLSRNYPIGTALRMGTGYVPRLLCWILLALGALVLFQGLNEAAPPQQAPPWSGLADSWRPLVFVTASLIVFGLTIETLGLVVSIFLLVGIGALAARMLRPVETIVAAAVLAALSYGIFIVGLQLTIPVWPEW